MDVVRVARNWEQMKALKKERGLPFQYHEIKDSGVQLCRVTLTDFNMMFYVDLIPNSPECIEFTAVYKDDSNKPVRQYFVNNRINEGFTTYWTGRGDDIENHGFGTGPRMKIKSEVASSAPGHLSVDVQLYEDHFLFGGRVHHVNGGEDDEFWFSLEAPASVYATNPGAGAYTMVEAEGYRFKLQEAGNFDLDLDAKLNANVDIHQVVPVPNNSAAGYFNYNYATNVISDAPDGDGYFDLYPGAGTLYIYANSLEMYGTDKEIYEADRAGKVLKHWTHRLKVKKAVDSEGTPMLMYGDLEIHRKSTR